MTIFQVTHKMRLINQEVRNIYYYETVVGNPSVSEWKDIVDEIRADFVAFPITAMIPEWEFYGIDYRIVDTAGLLSFEALPTAGKVVGTSTGDSVATQVAMLVSVKGTTTKPNRARTYLCGFSDGSMTLSRWGTTVILNAEIFIDLQSVLNAAGTNELQRVSAQWNATHTQVVASNNIAGSAGVGSPTPATQRRRRIGVGI